MLLTQDTGSVDYSIRSYQPGKIGVNETIYTTSVIISPSQLIEPWQPQQIDQLIVQHFEQVLSLSPEVVLLGTGLQLKFPNASLLAPLINQNIGVEVMDTGAACRTYNVLVAEGRKVVAALLIS